MYIAPGYTDDEIRSIVYEYERLRYGTKYAWVDKQSFSMHQLRRWRDAVYDGDLDRGLVPREGVDRSRSGGHSEMSGEFPDGGSGPRD